MKLIKYGIEIGIVWAIASGTKMFLCAINYILVNKQTDKLKKKVESIKEAMDAGKKEESAED